MTIKSALRSQSRAASKSPSVLTDACWTLTKSKRIVKMGSWTLVRLEPGVAWDRVVPDSKLQAVGQFFPNSMSQMSHGFFSPAKTSTNLNIPLFLHDLAAPSLRFFSSRVINVTNCHKCHLPRRPCTGIRMKEVRFGNVW